MKAKISRGSGFKGICNYVADPKRAEHIGGTISGTDRNSIYREFESVRALRPSIRKPVWHCSLALPISDGRINSEKWNQISNRFMEKMGFNEKSLHVTYRHTDTDYDHIHITACRINCEGEIWHGSHDVHKAIKATQELEEEFGLTITQGFYKKDDVSLSKNEMEMALRTEQLPPKLEIQETIKSVLAEGNCTSVEFCEKLKNKGVYAVPNITTTGKLNGYSFRLSDSEQKFTGKKVGFKLEKLEKMGVHYDQNRDSQELTKLRETSGQPQVVGEELGLDESFTADDRQQPVPRPQLSRRKTEVVEARPHQDIKESENITNPERKTVQEPYDYHNFDDDFGNSGSVEDDILEVVDDQDERKRIIDDLQDFDDTLDDYEYQIKCFEAVLEDVVDPKRLQHKVNEYEGYSLEELKEELTSRQITLSQYEENYYELERQVEEKEEDQDYGLSM